MALNMLKLKLNGNMRAAVWSDLHHVASANSYQDTTLVCKDGNISANRLAIGILFPCISQSFALEFLQVGKLKLYSLY